MSRLPLMTRARLWSASQRLLPIALGLSLLVLFVLTVGCGGKGILPTALLPTATQPSLLPGDTPPPGPTARQTATAYGSPPSEALLKTMDNLESQIEDVRGLDLAAPITISVMTRDELARFMEDEFTKEVKPEEVAQDVRVFAAFDFFAADYDLRSLLLQLYSEQVIGLYDNDSNSLYVVSNDAGIADGKLNLMDRMTFVHEMVHALQDEDLGLDKLTDPNDQTIDDEAQLAREALVEGDASLAMMQYVFAHPGQITAEDLQALEQGGGEESQDALDSAPPVIRETFMFPYVQGLDFVTALVEDGGWDAVDAAYRDPPQSSEQIMHPEKYLQRDEPQIVSLPPLTDTLGAGWTCVDTGMLGEFQLEIYLAQQVDDATAHTASMGWDGDTFAVHIRGDDTLLAYKMAWDSAQDRQEFVDAWRQYAESKFGQQATSTAQNRECWETPAQAGCLVWADTTSLIVLGPDRATVEGVLAAATP